MNVKPFSTVLTALSFYVKLRESKRKGFKLSRPTVEQLLCEELADKVDKKFYSKSPARKRDLNRTDELYHSSLPVERQFKKKRASF